MKKTILFAILVVCMMTAGSEQLYAAPPSQQGENQCLIRSPANGAQVRGQVPIIGVALHPEFEWYQVGYATDPNPDGKWNFFYNSEMAVENGQLAMWDTTLLADGVYKLLVEVHRRDGGLDLCFSEKLRVNNTAPTPTFTAAPLPTSADTPTPLPTPEDTPTVAIEQPPTATSRPTPTYSAVDNPTPTPEMTRIKLPIEPDSIRNASCKGAQVAIVAAVIITLYFIIRNIAASGIRQVRKPKDVDGFHRRKPREH